MRMFSSSAVTVLLALAGVSPLVAQVAAEAVWQLRPGDAVRVQIGDEQSLIGPLPTSRERLTILQPEQLQTSGRLFTVTEEGVALFPLIGAVRVAGRPFTEVRREIEEAYQAKLVGTAVLVTPVVRIAVLGEVRQPGLLPVDPTFTVADVLAAAGGITPLGNPSRITLSGDRGSIRFSLTDNGEVLAQPLRPGDQIVVPRRGWVRENLNVLIGAGASVLAAAVTTLLLQ